MNAYTRFPHLITPQPVSRELTQFFKGAMKTLRRWEHNYRTRKELANMDPYLLDDIGLTRFDVEQELKKPFWR